MGKISSHEYIIKLIDGYKDIDAYRLVYEDHNVDQTLTKVLDKFNEESSQKVIKDIVAALNHCHEKGIIHRDI